jgi:hypothetical protein
VDLNIIADRAYAERLFTALIPLNIEWYGLATVLLGRDLPLLDLAARSGCRGLLMGLESISPAALRASRKGFNSPDEYAGLVERLHEHGIALQGCFVFGLDDDTPDVFLKTARFAVEAKIDLPRFAIATPFPNTGLYKRLEAEGRIITKNWELYDGQHVVFPAAEHDGQGAPVGHGAGLEARLQPRRDRAPPQTLAGALERAAGYEPGLPVLCAPAAQVLHVRLDDWSGLECRHPPTTCNGSAAC